MEATFSLGRWIWMTFFGWLAGVVLIVVFSGIADALGIRESQFVVGTGMATGISCFQWLYLNKRTTLTYVWILSASIGMTLPFILFEINISRQSEYLLLISTVFGSAFYSFLQFLLLRRHYHKAWMWIPATILGWTASVGLLWFINSTMSFNSDGEMIFYLVFINLLLILGGGIIVGFTQGIAFKWLLKRMKN